MVNYKNSKIYKIICNITQNEYYGSTTKQYLSSRLQQHKTQYHRWLNDNKKKYYSSFEIIKNGDYKIILVEKLECNDKDELRQREQFFIDNNICVNKNRAFNTKEDTKKYEKKYRAINKDKIDERHKKYIEINKDKIKAQYKEYYENNKEKQKEYMKTYNNQNKEKITEYAKKSYEKNKDKIKKKHKEYYENNKEKRKEYMKTYNNKNKEYYQSNKDKRNIYLKNNSEKIAIQKKIYNLKYVKENKDKIKDKQKEYYENNKEKQKEYYENNKEMLNEQRRKMKKDKRAFLNSWGYEKIIFSCNLLNIDLSIFD